MANGNQTTKKSTIRSFRDWNRQHMSMPRHTILPHSDIDKQPESPGEHALEVRQGREAHKFLFKAQVIRKISDED